MIWKKSERQAYLDAIQSCYREADKRGKATILDEFCSVCGHNCKYAIRLLCKRRRSSSSTRRPGRKSIYNSPELLTALKRIWFATDQICSKKLKAAIPLWLPFYAGSYGPLSTEIEDKLLSISAATIDRILTHVRVRYGRKGLSGTKPVWLVTSSGL